MYAILVGLLFEFTFDTVFKSLTRCSAMSSPPNAFDMATENLIKNITFV